MTYENKTKFCKLWAIATGGECRASGRGREHTFTHLVLHAWQEFLDWICPTVLFNFEVRRQEYR